MRLPSFLLAALTCAAAASAAAGTALAADPPLPPLGDVLYRAEIRGDDRGPDTDEFGGRLLVGESLDVSVASDAQSGLYPLLEVAGPDGQVRPLVIRSTVSGRRLTVRKMPVDATGFWTVRVRAFAGTRGKYSARFHVRKAPRTRVVVEADRLGSTAADVTLPFQGLEGSQLRLRWGWKGAAAPTLASLVDPSGADVPGPDAPDPDTPGDPPALGDRAVVKRRAAQLLVDPIAAGDGTYAARFTAPAGHGTFRVEADVRPAGRATGTRTLTTDEPWIAPRTSPLRVAAGLKVRIAGEGFQSPRVLFDGAEGTDTFTDPYGTWIDVEPPELPDGTLARVAVVNADGQGYARDDFAYYVPAPTITDVTDVAGTPVIGGSTAGGLTVRVHGTNFVSGVLVRVGPSVAIVPQILNPGLLEFRTPAQVAGIVKVRLEDAYLHDPAAPGTFEYKDPPKFGAVPYAPPAASEAVPTVVALLGSAFTPGDVVLLDGVETATQLVSETSLAFLVPAGPVGSIQVSIRDRVGTVVKGPPISRSAP